MSDIDNQQSATETTHESSRSAQDRQPASANARTAGRNNTYDQKAQDAELNKLLEQVRTVIQSQNPYTQTGYIRLLRDLVLNQSTSRSLNTSNLIRNRLSQTLLGSRFLQIAGDFDRLMAFVERLASSKLSMETMKQSQEVNLEFMQIIANMVDRIVQVASVMDMDPNVFLDREIRSRAKDSKQAKTPHTTSQNEPEPTPSPVSRAL